MVYEKLWVIRAILQILKAIQHTEVVHLHNQTKTQWCSSLHVLWHHVWNECVAPGGGEMETDRERETEKETETTDETPNEPGVQDPNSVVRCTGGWAPNRTGRIQVFSYFLCSFICICTTGNNTLWPSFESWTHADVMYSTGTILFWVSDRIDQERRTLLVEPKEQHVSKTCSRHLQ